MSEISLETIKEIQDSQRNIKVIVGSVIGIILIFFFFTFASLVDKAPPIFFTIETIIAAIITPLLFILNRISFALVKFRKGKKVEFKDTLAKMDKNDVDKKAEKVLESFQS